MTNYLNSFFKQISVEQTLEEQGLSQDCNIHVHFGLCGGNRRPRLVDVAFGGCGVQVIDCS